MKTYLFDFDGTLVDSMPTYISAMLRILDENNIPYESDIVKTITPLGVNGTAEYYIKMGLDMPKEEIIDLIKRYLKHEYVYNIPAKEKVIEVLKALKERGDSLNVLTASPHVTLDPCLERIGIFDLFDNVWSCDDFKTTKANPEIYKMAAEKILFLDDNLSQSIQTRISLKWLFLGIFWLIELHRDKPYELLFTKIYYKNCTFKVKEFCK